MMMTLQKMLVETMVTAVKMALMITGSVSPSPTCILPQHPRGLAVVLVRWTWGAKLGSPQWCPHAELQLVVSLESTAKCLAQARAHVSHSEQVHTQLQPEPAL